MTMKESNKLIAEFMGAKNRATALPIIAKGMKDDELWLPVHGACSISRLNYHSSWGWLMPVVQRAHDLTTEHDRDFAGLTLFELSITAEIATVYEAVVSFIQWYNQQSQQ